MRGEERAAFHALLPDGVFTDEPLFVPLPPPTQGEVERLLASPRLDWAGLLRRTFALDIFLCTRCGGRRRVLAYLTNPPVVQAILTHVTSSPGSRSAPEARESGSPACEFM